MAWSYDPILQSASSTLASGTVYLIRIPLPHPAKVDNIIVEIQSAGIGLTSGGSFAGIYTTGGALVAATADQHSAWASAGSKSMALPAPALLPAGYVYVALLANGTTTPAFGRCTVQGAGAINAGLSPADSRYATGPIGQSSLPATISMGSLIQVANSFWAALS